MTIDEAERRRVRMVETQIAQRGVADASVLAAMRQVPREDFVAAQWRSSAYDDDPLPIENGQMISQPYIVARMLETAAIRSTDRLLEVGAGSGYASALASRIAVNVYAIERHAELGVLARARLAHLGYTNIALRCGDGTLGWPEAAPFDVILVSAGGPRVPEALLSQLATGGRLVMPVGAHGTYQRLTRVTRRGDAKFDTDVFEAVCFVPLIGAQGWSSNLNCD
ncbi:MAG: protein-L-isoaspartate(D-aspartate) O-methyltransferase [Granulicella sp.]